MKIIAWLYTLVVLAASLWDWATLFFANPLEEHLLPMFVYSFVIFPSSLLIAPISDLIPSLLHNGIAYQVVWRGLGAMQLAAVWLVALRFKRRQS